MARGGPEVLGARTLKPASVGISERATARAIALDAASDAASTAFWIAERRPARRKRSMKTPSP
eukprot:2842252-Alexandrium_andersonii.AAC.1